jgi:ATP-dependent RNA helicase DHX37/DHR1
MPLRISILDICAIDMDWIVELNPQLCQFGPIETEPEPRYNEQLDRMVCHRKATLGKRVSWSLGNPIETNFPSDSLDRFRWFAKYFLDGIICSRLQQFRPALLCSSNAMVKSWATLIERTQVFLNALVKKEIDSRARLIQIWSIESKCNCQ